MEADIDLNTFQKNVEAKESRFISLSSSPRTEITEYVGVFDDINRLV